MSAPPLAVTTFSLPDGRVGRAYSEGLQAGGGRLPYTWSRVEGSLPSGLTLGSEGIISGTPTSEGTFSFVVQVADAAGRIADRALAITIVAAAGGQSSSAPGRNR